MSDDDPGRRKRPLKRSDPRALRRFVQELSWLLATYEDLDFRALSDVVERGPGPRSASLFERLPNQGAAAAFLVGALPELFTDENLFPANEDIADFAENALGVIIPRWS